MVNGVSLGVGQVSEADTSDAAGRVVGEETISLRQVHVCADDHSRRRSLHVPTFSRPFRPRRLWDTRPRRMSPREFLSLYEYVT